MSICRVAAMQLKVSSELSANMENLDTKLAGLMSGNAENAENAERPDFVVLPEMFCCPYNAKLFPAFAEPEGGEVWQHLSGLAKEHGIYLVGGSVPECDSEGRIYNTCYIFDRKGRQIGKHRKMHMFDIAIKGRQSFRESDSVTPGDTVTVFDTEFGKAGAAICYDIRFPELFRIMALQGAGIVFVPGAFNMTTGPAHWTLNFRLRAVDNQYYMVGCSPSRNPDLGYVSYGHSIAADPWGNVLGELDEREGILRADIDLARMNSLREQLPLLKHRRPDIYRNYDQYL